ncbi:hypothetical protein J3Q64DRAFT_1779305 [Phycomyces blakesleeanus]|uniref:Uncharacterized protein n=1 Tax=Phycomyces blakesleeanus TaxID=4837 RepID=A0ABR3AHL8_PHYBL
MISLFQSNPKTFRQLEAFDLKTDKYFENFDFVLWELFCALNVPLKHLMLEATQRGEVGNSYPLDVSRILQSFSETLESLSVIGFICNYNEQYPTFELSYYYPLLKSLCISGSNLSLDIADLLDKCVALKQLKFCGGKLLINSDMPLKYSLTSH